MFKVGDRVRIKSTSPFYEGSKANPVHLNGTITSFARGFSLPYTVTWDNNETNKYDDYDLVKIETEQTSIGPITLVGEEKADRFNTGKPKLSMIDPEILNLAAQVLEFGALKYSPDNWKKGLPIDDVMDSLLRHAFAYAGGEDKDPESGISHLGHIVCNAMFIAYYKKEKK